jgi:hypothetical protein
MQLLKTQLITLAKMAAWRIGRQEMQPGNQDIFLFASRRGGSTWLMEVICSNPGIRWIDQPFSLFTGPQGLSQLIPVFECSEAINPDNGQLEMIRRYVGDLLSGRINMNTEWRLYSASFWRRKNRTLFKIVQGKSIAGQLCADFDAQPIVLFRHPVAQALSVMKAKWRCHASAFLNNCWFREEVLGDTAEKCDEFYDSEDPLVKYVLNWALENLLLIRSIESKKDWTWVTFEDCLVNPQRVVGVLAERFSLVQIDAMKRQIKVPSRTTGLTNENKKEPSGKKIGMWKDRCTLPQLGKCQELLDVLGIDLYSAHEPLPKIDLMQRLENLTANKLR